MATAASSLLYIPPPHTKFLFSHKHKPKSFLFLNDNVDNYSYPPLISPLILSHPPLSKQISILRHTKLPSFRASAAPENTTVSTTEQIVSTTTGDDGVSNVITTLLFIAFIGLSILTIGVIYIGVTDFLQKREKDKFEKEEEAKKKKKGGKKVVRPRAKAGPRGFGQKIIDDDDDDDL